jgi:hypothetical protein
MADKSYVLPVKTNSTESQTYECVTHFVDLSNLSTVVDPSEPTEPVEQMDDKPMPWKFILHMNEVENELLVQHDIIYFQHT